jgi:hypothetical protein
MNIAYIGVAVIGTVLGYLMHYLVRRDEKPGVADLGIIVGVLLAGTAINIVTPANSPPNQVYWYLIGLGIGFFLYWLALMFGREKGEVIVRTMGVREMESGEENLDLSDFIERKRRLSLFPFLK